MSTQTATVNKTEKRVNVRYLTVTAMLSAVAYILMFLDFSVPFMPAFIKKIGRAHRLNSSHDRQSRMPSSA